MISQEPEKVARWRDVTGAVHETREAAMVANAEDAVRKLVATCWEAGGSFGEDMTPSVAADEILENTDTFFEAISAVCKARRALAKGSAS